MKTIVITGSTRGIGFGLAGSFLSAGCNVVISGRTQEAIGLALNKLGTGIFKDRILGFICDTQIRFPKPGQSPSPKSTRLLIPTLKVLSTGPRSQ
jgi:NAD(P)-dependent dehydrogenase (short-subunit alcohol dehydrogenase family)